MNKIIEILVTYSTVYYLDHYVPAWTKTCVSRIIACEQRALGVVINLCDTCHKTYLADCTCNSKNCPCCGFLQTYKWLDKAADVFPTMPYQHIVFTVPLFIRLFYNDNFKPMTKIQFESLSEALQHFAKSTSSPPLRYGTFNRHRGTKAQRHKV